MHVKFQAKIRDVKSNVSEVGDGRTTVTLIADYVSAEVSAFLYALQKLDENKSRELWVVISDTKPE